MFLMNRFISQARLSFLKLLLATESFIFYELLAVIVALSVNLEVHQPFQSHYPAPFLFNRAKGQVIHIAL